MRFEVRDRLLPTCERALDAAIAAFGAWTVVVHALVFLFAGTFRAAAWAGVILPLAAWAAWRTAPTGVAPPPSIAVPPRLARADRIGWLLVACLIVLALALGVASTWVWLGVCVYLVALLLTTPDRAAVDQGAPVTTRQATVFLAIMALAAFLAAVAHRPDSDDGFLINSALWNLDHPSLPLYSEDGMHHPPGLPVVFPTYRVHTFEVFFSLAAAALRLEPIDVAHVVLPPIASAGAVAASALLLRFLLPRAWAGALGFLLLFWLTMGDNHEGFANHALVRIFQGKAVMVTVVLPYLAFAVMRFVRTRTLRDWLLVAAAITTCAGLSATGLFVAPLALMCALSAVLALRPRAILPAAVCGLAVAYSGAIALLVRSQVVDRLDILNSDALYGYVKKFGDSFEQAMGVGPFLHLQMLGVLAAPAIAADGPRRRWLAGLLLPYFAVVTQPWLFETWVGHVTSAPVAFRLWWAVPVPLLVAFSLAAPLEGLGAAQRWIRAAILATGAILLAAVPDTWALSAANHVRLAVPGRKVPPLDYRIARTICKLAPPGSSVLAPREVVMWVTTVPGHPRVVVHKMNTLKVLSPYMPESELARRMRLFAYISGQGRAAWSAEELRQSLLALDIGVVLRPTRLPWAAEVDAVLESSGFLRRDVPGYVLWSRATTSDSLETRLR